MRQVRMVCVLLMGAVVLTACDRSGGGEVNRALQDLNVIDESNLNDVMLASADPVEAVNYFRRSAASEPDRIDFQRGLAKSLIRADRTTEAVAAWRGVAAHPEATHDDKVALADAMIRANLWDEAKAVLDGIPPTHETYRRYRLEAMIADSNEDWADADAFYEIALGLTTDPAPVLNNWGYSKLTRGEFGEAERLFLDAIKNDSQLFTAKNNLMLARGAQRIYELPVVPMSQIERAQLLHTLGLAAIKQNDIAIGRGLLQEAIDTHPQHFEEAARAMAALESNVQN